MALAKVPLQCDGIERNAISRSARLKHQESRHDIDGILKLAAQETRTMRSGENPSVAQTDVPSADVAGAARNAMPAAGPELEFVISLRGRRQLGARLRGGNGEMQEQKQYRCGENFHLLLHRVLKYECVLHDLCTGLDAGSDLLHVSGKRIATFYFHALELAISRGDEHPVVVVQMQDCGCWNYGVNFLLQAMEGCGREHAWAHESGIANFNANLGGANGWVENRADVADRALDNLIRVSVQLNVGRLAEPHVGEIILINVAENPYVGQIGNRERVRRRQTLHSRCIGDFLVRDYAGDGCDDIDDSARMIGIIAEEPKMFRGGFERGLRIILGVLRSLHLCLRDRSVREEIFLPVELRAREKFVGDGFPVVGIGRGNIVTPNA